MGNAKNRVEEDFSVTGRLHQGFWPFWPIMHCCRSNSANAFLHAHVWSSDHRRMLNLSHPTRTQWIFSFLPPVLSSVRTSRFTFNPHNHMKSQNIPHKLLLHPPHLPLKCLHLLPTIQRPPIIQPQTAHHALPGPLQLLRQLLQRLPLAQFLLQRFDLRLHCLRRLLRGWRCVFQAWYCGREFAWGFRLGGRGRRGKLALDLRQAF